MAWVLFTCSRLFSHCYHHASKIIWSLSSPWSHFHEGAVAWHGLWTTDDFFRACERKCIRTPMYRALSCRQPHIKPSSLELTLPAQRSPYSYPTMFGPKFLASVYLAVICASGAHAFALDSRKFSTHQVRQIGRGLTVESFHPVSTYEVSHLRIISNGHELIVNSDLRS